jgi:hypothetical protein
MPGVGRVSRLVLGVGIALLFVAGCGGSDDEADARDQADWRTDWRMRHPETAKPPRLQGFPQHRYGDSNPGFRTENPAS